MDDIDNNNDDIDDNEPSDEGFLLFLDAHNDNQYAVYVNQPAGVIKTPIAIDAQGKVSLTVPNGTIAFEDGSYHGVYDENDLHKGLAYSNILLMNGTELVTQQVAYEWEIFKHQVEGQEFYGASYKMLDESVEALKEAKFPDTVPKTFKIDKFAPGDAQPDEIPYLMLPPHHPDGADRMVQYLHDVPHKKLVNDLNSLKQVQMVQDIPDNTPAKTNGVDPKNYKVSDKDLAAALKTYTQDITARAERGEIYDIIGGEDDIKLGIEVMNSRDKSWICFTGESEVGKTERAFAITKYLYENKEKLPERLQNARVLQLDIEAMNTTSYVGEAEKRLRTITDGLMERGGIFKGERIITLLDEAHKHLSLSRGGSNMGQILKDFLNTVGISGMATTTSDEYKKHIAEDKALRNRIRQKQVEPPDYEATKTIVRRKFEVYKQYHELNKDLTEDQIAMVVDKTNRMMPNAAQPGKALKAIDLAGSKAAIAHRKEISNEDILEAVVQNSGYSLSFIQQTDGERLMKLREELPKVILGQPGIENITDGLVGSSAGLSDPRKPKAAYILQGPTRTGKTETARQIAKIMFGDENALIRIDMSEYGEKHTVSNLIGSPKGYVGSEEGGKLTEAVRKKPYSVVLLDEIDKAHPDVFNVLLAVLDNGQLSDINNNVIPFNNTIILMSSNAGAREASAILAGKASGAGLGGGEIDREQVLADLQESNQRAIRKIFPPEAINRINELGGIIFYGSLDKMIISQIVEREVKDLEKRLNDPTAGAMKGVKLEISPTYLEQLSEESYDPEFNAGPVKRVMRQKIINPLSQWLLTDNNRQKVIDYAEKNGGVKITLSGDGLEPVIGPAPDSGLKSAFSHSNDNVGKKPKISPGSKRKRGNGNTPGA